MNFFKANTISKKFLIPTLSLTILLVGGLGIMLSMNNENSIRSMMDSKGNAMVGFLTKISVQNYENYDFLGLDDLVNETATDPEVEFVVFYDEQNKPLTTTIKEPEDISLMMVMEREITGSDGNLLGRLKLGYNYSRLNEALRKNTITVIISMGALLLLIIAINIITRSITGPVKQLLECFNKMAGGDLSQQVDIKSNDEIGQLAETFNRMSSKLHDMVGNVALHSSNVAASASQLSVSSKNIANNAHDQSSGTSQAAAAMEELNSSFMDVAQNTTNAADSAREATELAIKGGAVVSETIGGMNRISTSVNESAQTIEALGKRSEQIGEIIKVINDIASQTNLLALNAAIEAARAGEQGRGFAVVADEVRKLAERTTSATNEIGDMVNGIQDDTGRAVLAMQGGTKEVEAEVELANQAGEALQHIVVSVQNVTDMVQQIATAAEEQSSAGSEIASSLESVASLTHETSGSARESSEATEQLHTMASDLQSLVSGFKLRNGNGSVNYARADGASIHDPE